ncbi:MAG: hypothetical protein ACAI35_08215 [Candidatus Methylacidiphilales bacterium]|nr:hypothetical protein [Candidatus Methylacidiphilales bacterium]
MDNVNVTVDDPTVIAKHAEDHTDLPPWRFDHLQRMTDSTGIFQHAIYCVPWFEHGYCTDDNARALLLALMLEELEEGGSEISRIRSAAAGFLNHALVVENGRFRNFMGFNRNWLEEVGSEDSHGRALWALGAAVGRANHVGFRNWAAERFQQALPTVANFVWPHSWAFTILGLHEYLRVLDGDPLASRMRLELSDQLLDWFVKNSSADWCWGEDIVTYDSARLPHALILTGRWTRNTAMLDMGLRSLRWLMNAQTTEQGYFRPVGCKGFWHRNSKPACFDQQPLEAAASVSACIEAFHATGHAEWKREARRAFEWFLGANDLRLPVYDASTGGCCDGLEEGRLNMNQGAESTLSFLLALAEMRSLQNTTPGTRAHAVSR